MMLKKPKIAICFSGQTRHFNKNPQYTEDFNNILALFDDYDYDLFGHTWSDQEDPHPEVLNQFTSYRSDSQDIIWDTIIDHKQFGNRYFPVWSQYFQTKEDWFEKEEYIDILKGKSDTNYIDFARERINGTVGQIWSAHESFLLTKNYFISPPEHGWAPTTYVFVVKLRWDLMINLYNGREYVQTRIDRLKEVIHNWSNDKMEYNQAFGKRSPSCLCADDCLLSYNSTPYANDHMYIFDGEKFEKSDMLTHSPVILLADLLLKMEGSFPALPSAHTLWMDWILSAGFEVNAVLPNILQPNGPSGNKINKDWNI